LVQRLGQTATDPGAAACDEDGVFREFHRGPYGMETLSSGARSMFARDSAPSSKYYVRTYLIVKRPNPTLAGQAVLIINKDSCIV